MSDFLALLSKPMCRDIAERIKMFKPTHLVLFENQQMDSSNFGNRTCLCVGPNNTYKTVEDVKSSHLNDLPSQRQYPTCFCRIDP